MTDDKKFMHLALNEALKAYAEGEVPIGVVLIDENNNLVVHNHNRIEQNNDAMAHAELLVLRSASKKLNRRFLSNCTLYSTVEPCAMCAGALVLCRIHRLVYGVADSRFGAVESLFNVTNNPALNHQLKITAGVLEEECLTLIKKFFLERRSHKKKRRI